MGFGFPGWSHTVWRVTNLARYQRAADSYQGVRVVRLQRCAEAFVAAAMFACPVFANAGDTDVYTLPSVGQEGAYMVDWQSDTRAKVHTQLGSSIGDYTGGAQRIITFDKPYKVIGYGVDQCDEQIGLRMEMTQLVVRKTGKRTSAIVEIWKWTNIGGCQDGLVRYFGSPDDPGVAVNRVSLEDRLPVDDLVPGVVMAGFSEDTSIPGDGEPSIAQDVVTFQAGSATFRASGRTVPVEVSDR